MAGSNERKKILIVDDDRALNDLLTRYLAKFEFDVISATNSVDASALLQKERPEVVILDVMLPGKSGYEICKEIRQESVVPIIMLTARGDISDRVIGLELGADDYLPKPYEPRELVARIQSVLRRTQEYAFKSRTRRILRSEGLLVDTGKSTVLLDGFPLDLTSTEFQILSLLMHHHGDTLSRDQIVDRLRGYEWNSVDRTVDVLISRIRQKLKDDPKTPRFLKTYWGSGYRFIGEVIIENG